MDTLFERVALLQNQTELSGWATETDVKMKKAHCLWLDVFNDNAAFQSDREKNEWQEEVAHDFATWLLRKLENKDAYLLGDNEHSYFKSCVCSNSKSLSGTRQSWEICKMSQYILIKKLNVQNANAIAGLTYGFPAITNFLGFAHVLSRKLPASLKVNLGGVVVISHKNQVHARQPKGWGDCVCINP